MATFLYTLTVPAQTTNSAPAEARYTLPAGVLSHVTLFFPPGPQAEVGVRLLHNRSQFYPSRVGQWVAWDSGAVTSRINLPMSAGDTDIVIQAKSPDANFEHVVTVKLDVEPQGVILEDLEITDAIDRVEVLLGDL